MTLPLINHRYRILRSLAKGGFGETFLVEDTQLPSGRHCLLKQLTPVENNSQIYQLVQDRFQREAAILEELGEHGNGQIPRLYAYFSEGDQFYLVQEYIEGETLTQRLQKQGRFSEASVRELLLGILPILDYVHSYRIVHRDIKPDNILLRYRDHQPVLIDFGAVKETMGTLINAQGYSTKSIIIGTPGFMPSEQAAGRPMYASDLYGLGLTMIYLLTGKMPQELPTDPLTGTIQWRSDAPLVSSSFANLLDRAILPNGHDRYQTAQQMLDALLASASTTPPAPAVSVPAPTIASPPIWGYPGVAPSPGYGGNEHNGNQANANYANPYVLPDTTPTSSHYGSANRGYAYPSQPPTMSVAQTVPPPQPISVSQPPSPSGIGWGKAMLMGSFIGGFILVGLWLTRPQWILTQPEPDRLPDSVPTDPSPLTTPTPVLEPSTQVIDPAPAFVPSPLIESTPIPVPTPTIVPPQASISQQAAVDLIATWLQAKRVMFAPPYDAQLVEELTTGALYTDITKPNGSIDWLKTNNAYYQFGVQKIESVERFAANGDQATIEVQITEDRALFVNGRRDASNSSFDTKRFRYTLVSTGGSWKIADYDPID